MGREKKHIFFVPITSFYQTQQCTSEAVVSTKKLQRMERAKVEFLFQVSFNGVVQPMNGRHIFEGKTEASPPSTVSQGAASLVCFLLLSPPHCSLKRRKRREKKTGNILLSGGHAPGALKKIAVSRCKRDRTALPVDGFLSSPESWDLTLDGDLSSHPHFQGGFRSSRLSSKGSHVSSFELF